MANKYVVRATVEVGGASITDFKGVTEAEVTPAKVVPLMHSTGAAQLTKRFAFSLDYVVPQGTQVDWYGVSNTTASIIYDDATRTDFGGVEVITVGEGALDGENELVRRISFMAATRNGASE